MRQENPTVLSQPAQNVEKLFDAFFPSFFPSCSEALIANPFVSQLQGTPPLAGGAWQARGTSEIPDWARREAGDELGWAGREELLLHGSNKQSFPERCWEHPGSKSA